MADNYIDVPQDINTENPVFIDKDTMKPKRLVKIYEREFNKQVQNYEMFL